MRFSLFALFLAGCTINNVTEQYYTVPTDDTIDTGSDNGDTGIESVPEADTSDVIPGAPAITTDATDMTISPFGNDGNLYWFDVDPDEVDAMNTAWQNSWYYGGYYYSIDDSNTSARNLIIGDALTGDVANYGKVQTSVVGQSTGMTWDDSSIPDLSVDTTEFKDGIAVGDTHRLRFNNGMVSSIFREAIALQIFTDLGYPAARTSFAWVGSNVWDTDVRVPYTLVETYRKDGWCIDHADELGGGCVNIWEGYGDFDPDWAWGLDIGTQCQEKTCDNTRLNEFVAVMAETPPTSSGFEAATADYVDWPMVQQHMCLDWMLWIGDDPYHNMNNVVAVEGMDGKFRLLPYSTDISGGMDWYQNTALYGGNMLATGCAYDADCWTETISTCEATIDAFQALDPASIVDSVYARLSAQGMLRDGDDATYAELKTWYTDRSTEGVLEEELEIYRSGLTIDPCNVIVDTGGFRGGGQAYPADTGSNPCAYDTAADTSAPPADTAAPADTGA